MTLICAAVAALATTAGCAASTGTVGASGGLPTGGSPASASSAGSTTASTPDSSPDNSPDSAAPATTTATGSAPAPVTSSAVPAGQWQPIGDLAKSEPVDESVGPDHKVTVLWPKGSPADHALKITLLAKRNGDKLDVTLHAANNSGQQVSLLTGAFGGAQALDAAGQGLDLDEFDDDWTLTNPGNSPYLQPGDPMNGVMVVAAPKAGNTFQLYWTQAVNIGGIILVRDIPIVG